MAQITINTFCKKAFQKFVEAGMTPQGAAGMCGNIYSESAGFYANRVEFLCLQRLKENGIKDKNGNDYTDTTYTDEVDSGRITKASFLNPLPNKRYGFGAVQWTSVDRKQGLYERTVEKGKSIADEDVQIEYCLYELKNKYTSVWNILTSTDSVKTASDKVLKDFESPSDWSSLSSTRYDYSQQVYDSLKSTVNSTTTNTNGGGGTVSTTISPDSVIAIAKEEIGYLEKKSNSDLDSKTGNAGSGNYTKYWRDMANLGLGNYQGSYWCACFVHWCFYKAYGLATSQSLLLQSFFINCQTMYTLATNKGQIYTTPQVGDVVLFWTSSTSQYGHTGIVIAVSSDGKTFTTIEGNTSGGSTVVSNGGGVAQKTYTLSSLNKPRFVRPKYTSTVSSTTTSTSSPTNTVKSSYNKTEKWVGVVTADSLNVRKGEGTSYGTCSFSPLAKGTEVSVCDSSTASDGSTWYYIKYNDKYGFVHSSYISKATSTTTTTTTTKKTTTTTTTKKTTSSTTTTKKVTASNYADYYNKSLAGTYKTTTDLYMRDGAGTGKKALCVIPKGTSVTNYGYYSLSGNTKWLYIQFTDKNGTQYTGFSSSTYLKK